MKLDWKIYNWSELTTDILYSILALRSEVFIVEQDCVYQDIDRKDQNAKHLLGYDNDLLVAHSRLLKPGDYFDQHSFGRAVVKKTLILSRARGSGAPWAARPLPVPKKLFSTTVSRALVKKPSFWQIRF